MDDGSQSNTKNSAPLVLTNDDGIDAPGLDALRRAAGEIGEVRVVAPSDPWSSMSHAVTSGKAIRVDRRGPGRMAVAGTPADCVRLALHHLAPGPAWVLSGINRGGNLGADVHHSGTVAAAREAVLHGVPAIALSQYVRRGQPIDWDRTARWARRVLEVLLGRPWKPGTLWNVNFPHKTPDDPDPDLVFCPLDPSPLPLGFAVDGDEATYNGDYHGRGRVPGADVETCFGGRITLSLVRILPDPGAAAAEPPEILPMHPDQDGAPATSGR